MQVDRTPLSIPAEQLIAAGEHQAAAEAATQPPAAPSKPLNTKVGEEAPKQQWRVPVLPKKFALEPAMAEATAKAARYLEKQLPPGEMALDLRQEPEWQAEVRELGSGEVKYTYSSKQMITYMAQQLQRTGVIVDGTV